uniref:Uncharacterized protein n=1 Tax=Ursus maritimus TaxID=29073 RepID=A0A452TUB0_URSMA
PRSCSVWHARGQPSRKNLELAPEMLLQEGMIPLKVRLPTGFIFSISCVYLMVWVAFLYGCWC